MIHKYHTLEDTVYFWFASNVYSTGSGGDGANPVYDVRLAGAASDAAPVLSGSATLLSHVNYPDGCHEIAIAATAVNGFSANNEYAVFCTLLIDAQNPTGYAGSFSLKPVLVNYASIADAVWDEILTGVTHNIATSAGRRIREIESNVIITGISPGTGNTAIRIELDGNASATDGAYDPAIIIIVEGTGAGQSRQIFEYDGTNKYAYINRDWKVIPDATSQYTIIGHSGDTHTNEGLATGGGNDYITLNPLASTVNSTYVGQTVFLCAGTGQDQSRHITAYNGTTKVATVDRAWDTNPAANATIYAMLPNTDIESIINDIDEIKGVGWTTETLVTIETAILAIVSDATAANQTDIIDKLKGLMSKAYTLATAVGTFNPATDSTEAIRDHGDAAWITGGGVAGSNTVTININDGVNPLPDVSVQVWNSDASALMTYATTDSNGQVSVTADDGTYKVKLKKAGYSFNSTEDLTVLGNTANTYSGTTMAPAAPASATVCRVYEYLLNKDGTVPASVSGTAQITSLPETDAGNAYIGVATQPDSYSSSTGLVYWDIVRGATVRLLISSFGFDKTFIVPDTATALIEDQTDTP